MITVRDRDKKRLNCFLYSVRKKYKNKVLIMNVFDKLEENLKENNYLYGFYEFGDSFNNRKKLRMLIGYSRYFHKLCHYHKIHFYKYNQSWASCKENFGDMYGESCVLNDNLFANKQIKKIENVTTTGYCLFLYYNCIWILSLPDGLFDTFDYYNFNYDFYNKIIISNRININNLYPNFYVKLVDKA